MKDKKGQTGTIIVAGVIAVIIGVAMIPVLTSLIDDEQSIVESYMEQITTSAANQTTTLDHDDLIIGSVVVVNATGDNTDGAITYRDGEEYYLTEATGQIGFYNLTSTFNVTYNYEPDGYVDTATGRTIVRQITLMYAVALIVITLAAVGITLTRG